MCLEQTTHLVSFEPVTSLGSGFRGWAEQERNEFVRQLEVSEPDFVSKVLPRKWLLQLVKNDIKKSKKKIKEDRQS